MKVCRFCAEEIQDAAIVCKHCKRSVASRQMSQAGVFLMFVAVTAFIYSFVFFPTAIASASGERRIHNLGLLQDRQIYIAVSLVLAAIASLVLWKWPRTERTRSQRMTGWLWVGVGLLVWSAWITYVYIYMEVLTS